jgi:hypothetical protein
MVSVRHLLAAIVTLALVGSHAGVVAAAMCQHDVDAAHEAGSPSGHTPVAAFYDAATTDDLERVRLLPDMAMATPAEPPSDQWRAAAPRTLPHRRCCAAPATASPLRGPPLATT